MQTLKELTEANGGATVSIETAEQNPHTSGYYVGGVVPSVTFESSTATEMGYAVAVSSLLNLPGVDGSAYIGTWVDTDTDTVYVDVTEHYTDRTEALRVAADRGELAIWDIAANEEVRVP